ncbi:MAG: hypothetical protein IKV88_07305 [Clostridia bacterium]|nr:hypothetical protein [Clostridia bacterium]
MTLHDFICSALEYCNPLNYDLSSEIKKARKKTDELYSEKAPDSDSSDAFVKSRM